MRAFGVAVIVAGMYVATARPVVAQVSFNVAGLYATLSGSDFQGTNAGSGADGQIRFPLGQAGLSLGAGAQWTSHSVDGIDPNWSVIGVFGEPRYVFKTGGSSQLAPYIAGRAGWLHESISDGTDKLSASGFYFGGGGGLLIGLGGVNLDIGVLFASVNFGEVDLNGSSTGFKPSGTSLALRAGLAFGGK
jgi:hypothetical protein